MVLVTVYTGTVVADFAPIANFDSQSATDSRMRVLEIIAHPEQERAKKNIGGIRHTPES